MLPKYAVEIARLAFRYPGRSVEAIAIDDFRIETGTCQILVGPNGAGKTTLCKLLCGLVKAPANSDGSVLGIPLRRMRPGAHGRIVASFGGDRGFYLKLTALENLRVWAHIYGQSEQRVSEVLDVIHLRAKQHAPVRTLSRGMRQWLHIGRALLGDPELLILDEPTLGMDPVGRQRFIDLVGELRGQGKTIVITTHDLEDAAAVGDHVAFIGDGKIIHSVAQSAIRERTTPVRVRAVLSLPGVEALERAAGQGEGATRVVDEWLLPAEALQFLATLDPDLLQVLSVEPQQLRGQYLERFGES